MDFTLSIDENVYIYVFFKGLPIDHKHVSFTSNCTINCILLIVLLFIEHSLTSEIFIYHVYN